MDQRQGGNRKMEGVIDTTASPLDKFFQPSITKMLKLSHNVSESLPPATESPRTTVHLINSEITDQDKGMHPLPSRGHGDECRPWPGLWVGKRLYKHGSIHGLGLIHFPPN